MRVLAVEGGPIQAVFGSFENTWLWVILGISLVALLFAYYLVREVLAAPEGTENTTVTLTPTPLPSVPRLHGKPPAQGAVADTKVRPAGVGSASDTFAALLGPLLVTASV